MTRFSQTESLILVGCSEIKRISENLSQTNLKLYPSQLRKYKNTSKYGKLDKIKIKFLQKTSDSRGTLFLLLSSDQTINYTKCSF